MSNYLPVRSLCFYVHLGNCSNEYCAVHCFRFGPGLAIYWFGFIDELDCNRQDGVMVMDNLPEKIIFMDPNNLLKQEKVIPHRKLLKTQNAPSTTNWTVARDWEIQQCVAECYMCERRNGEVFAVLKDFVNFIILFFLWLSQIYLGMLEVAGWLFSC